MTGLLAGKFLGSGQTCISPNRIYVQSGIHDAFDTEEEVIAQANQSEVGLGAYVYTENLPTAWSVAEALQGESEYSIYTLDPSR